MSAPRSDTRPAAGRRLPGPLARWVSRAAAALVAAVLLPPLAAAEFHVAVTGTAGGDGSAARPWDLQTALQHPAAVRPGDTISLHGGTYAGQFTSALTGTAAAPITVRSRPGEWARLAGNGTIAAPLWVNGGGHAVFRDFEVTSSVADRRLRGQAGVIVHVANASFINLIVHDNAGGGFGSSSAAHNALFYGNIVYNNGYDADDRGHGHAFYLQNSDPNQPQVVRDNIFFNSFSYGVHCYGQQGLLKGFTISGNTFFANGAASKVSDFKDNVLVGGETPSERIVIEDNLGWALAPGERSIQLGYGADSLDATLRGNFLRGRTRFATAWNPIVITGNTFIGPLDGAGDPALYPDNTFRGDPTSGADVFVRPNAHQPGRAHITVFNWGGADRVAVDVGTVFGSGTEFIVRNAQDWFGAPVLSGTYRGTPLMLPMTGMDAVEPIGHAGALEPGERTGRAFNVFVIDAVGAAVPGTTGGGTTGGTGTSTGGATGGSTGSTAPSNRSSDVGCGAGGMASAAVAIALLVFARAPRP
ncbi:MAG TPA: right-handed parallel beta-helix repeat-containing protein [Planctomycetota bacterium]|nr:right-handed parallel beta-helix repeat-containing protein [Planctomycetota bacterium]